MAARPPTSRACISGRSAAPCRIAIYTAPLFKTSNDIDNRASVAEQATEALDLVGVGIHGERKIVDKVINGLKFFV